MLEPGPLPLVSKRGILPVYCFAWYLSAHQFLGGIFLRSLIMKWETPTAVDWRFGFEITMYIANR
jgi:coenzyme PQQ precursor peptide PqqA